MVEIAKFFLSSQLKKVFQNTDHTQAIGGSPWPENQTCVPGAEWKLKSESWRRCIMPYLVHTAHAQFVGFWMGAIGWIFTMVAIGLVQWRICSLCRSVGLLIVIITFFLWLWKTTYVFWVPKTFMYQKIIHFCIWRAQSRHERSRVPYVVHRVFRLYLPSRCPGTLLCSLSIHTVHLSFPLKPYQILSNSWT